MTLIFFHATTRLESCGSKPLQGQEGLLRQQLRGFSVHDESLLTWHSTRLAAILTSTALHFAQDSHGRPPNLQECLSLNVGLILNFL